MGNNPYEKKPNTEEETFFTQADEKKSGTNGEQTGKNPYANGTYAKNSEKENTLKGKD